MRNLARYVVQFNTELGVYDRKTFRLRQCVGEARDNHGYLRQIQGHDV